MAAIPLRAASTEAGPLLFHTRVLVPTLHTAWSLSSADPEQGNTTRLMSLLFTNNSIQFARSPSLEPESVSMSGKPDSDSSSSSVSCHSSLKRSAKTPPKPHTFAPALIHIYIPGGVRTLFLLVHIGQHAERWAIAQESLNSSCLPRQALAPPHGPRFQPAHWSAPSHRPSPHT